MTTRPLLHLGYVKTASTFLQFHVFSSHRHGFAEPVEKSRAVITDRLVIPNTYTFDPEAERQRFEDMNSGVEAPLVPVWSEEVLLGDPFQRRYDGAVLADRLRAVMPEGRVFICIREQKKMALSVYREHVKLGGVQPLRDVIGTGREEISYTPILRPDFMMFSQAIAYYQDLFGKENVLVLPQEMLRADGDGFLRRLQGFAGVSEEADSRLPEAEANTGRSAGSLDITRTLNRFRTRSPLTFPDAFTDRAVARLSQLSSQAIPSSRHEKSEAELKEAIRTRYEGVYAEDNARTAELTGLDLKSYGYEVAS